MNEAVAVSSVSACEPDNRGVEIAHARVQPPALVSVRVRLDRLGMWPMIQRIAREHLVSPEAAISRNRQVSTALARHHIWAVIRWTLGLSYPEIAALFDVDHTTIMSGVARWEHEIMSGS